MIVINDKGIPYDDYDWGPAAGTHPTEDEVGDWDDEELGDTWHPGHPSNYGDR